MTEVAVDVDQLRTGGIEVDTAAQGVRDAANAGGSAQRMSDDAFGLLCLSMVPPAQIAQTSGVVAINAIAAAIEKTATAVSDSASDYDTSDSTNATSMRRIEGSLQ